jgi:replicative DNA helicase
MRQDSSVLETIYPYHDEHGEKIYEVLRYRKADGDKTFRQRQSEDNWSMRGVTPLLYRLPEVLAGRVDGHTIHYVEGEKDADTLAHLGYCATTHHGGANNIPAIEGTAHYLKGADVIVWPDQDQAGRQHANALIKILHEAGARSVREINVPHGKDVTEYIELHGSGQLENLIATATETVAQRGETAPSKVAPHSLSAETALLGSIMINPDVLHDVSFIQTADFFSARNGQIFDAMFAIFSRGHGLDGLTLSEELRKRGQLDKVGGLAFLTALVNDTPTHIHAVTYARLVHNSAVRRRLIAAAVQITKVASEDNAELAEIVGRCEELLFAVTKQHRDSDLVTIGEAATEHVDLLAKRGETKDYSHGIQTGWTEVNKILGAIEPEKLVIIGARPGMGKTAWMLNFAVEAAKQEKRTMIFSLEMGRSELMDRVYSAELEIPSQQLKRGDIDEQWERIIAQTTLLTSWPIILDTSTDLSPSVLRAKCRQVKRERGLDLVIIDYLQLMCSGRDEENQTAELTFISRQLKLMAMELGVTVVAASQLSRAVEQRADHRPLLSDLRYSGSIEQDADIVIMLYRDEVYTKERSQRPGEADMIVAKQRNGPTGEAPTIWRPAFTKFVDRQSANIDVQPW